MGNLLSIAQYPRDLPKQVRKRSKLRENLAPLYKRVVKRREEDSGGGGEGGDWGLVGWGLVREGEGVEGAEGGGERLRTRYLICYTWLLSSLLPVLSTSQEVLFCVCPQQFQIVPVTKTQ